ncbi:MAG: hypothetical protein ACJA13_000241 [Paraglaciecola sp.]|jgi:hypothetical protein
MTKYDFGSRKIYGDLTEKTNCRKNQNIKKNQLKIHSQNKYETLIPVITKLVQKSSEN